MIPTMHRTGTHYPSFTFTFGPESKLPQPEARSRRFENKLPQGNHHSGEARSIDIFDKARSYDDILWIETRTVHTHG